MTAKPLTGLFAVCDPNGVLVHTTVATDEKSAIELWMDIEKSHNWISNLCRQAKGPRLKIYRPTCMQSWEAFEAEGYAVVPVGLFPA